MHYARECSYRKHKCECGVVGHKEGYCQAGKKNKKKQWQKKNGKKGKAVNVSTKSIFVVYKIDSLRKYVKEEINKVEINLQLDTAFDITIISEDNFKKLKVANAIDVVYTARGARGKLPLSLKFDCDINFKSKKATSTCFVTSIKGLNVMGVDWITVLQVGNMPINKICNKISTEH